MKRLGPRTVVLIGGVGAVIVAGGAAALGSWSVPPPNARVIVHSAELPVGPTPTARRLSAGIKISWTPISPGRIPIDGYRVVRYTAGQPEQTDQQSCIVTQGSQCVDLTVKAGLTYTYTVRAVRAAWLGKEGDASGSVTTSQGQVSPKQGSDTTAANQTPTPGPVEPTAPAPTVTPTQQPPAADPTTQAPSPVPSDQPSSAPQG